MSSNFERQIWNTKGTLLYLIISCETKMYDTIKTHYCATSVTTDFLCDFTESENHSKECNSLYLDGG